MLLVLHVLPGSGAKVSNATIDSSALRAVKVSRATIAPSEPNAVKVASATSAPIATSAEKITKVLLGLLFRVRFWHPYCSQNSAINRTILGAIFRTLLK